MKAPLPVTLFVSASLAVLPGASRVSEAFAAVPAQAAAAASAATPITTRPLPTADFAQTTAHLDKSLVPNVVGQIKPDAQQSFQIKGQGFPDFSIVPVRYQSTSSDNQQPTSRCGVYVVPAQGSATFVRTLGYGNREAEICGGLLGVGFLPDHGRPPRIILLYNGGSFNSPGKDPVILAWQANSYASDDDVVTRLGNAATVPAIKAKLKAVRP